MRFRQVYYILLGLLVAGCGQPPALPVADPIRLEEGFTDPPVSVRPRGLWTWLNGNVDTAQITLELREAKIKGMGGFDIWDVGMLVDPDSVVPAGPPFMGPESVKAIGFAVRTAEQLDLDLGLTIASSWNAGGEWIRPEHGAMGLFRSSVEVEGPVLFDATLPFPDLVKDATEQRSPPLLRLDPTTGLPEFYREVAVLAIPLFPDSLIDKSGQVIDLSAKMNPDGHLEWTVPAGQWRITRYVCTGTGQPLVIPSARSNGLILDHFSPEAMEAHLKVFTDRLTAELGHLDHRALKYFYTDSYEVKAAVWTPRLQEEFKTRCGYDLTPYLPILDGYTIENEDISQRFLFDFHKTLSDLIIENHYQNGARLAAKAGLGFVAEAGGPGPPIHNVPFEDLKALGSLTIPRGEFWNKHPQLDQLQIVKGIASAAHVYNQPAVEAESFTSVWIWQEGPQELKPLADRALCEGLNRFVYHTFPHTPKAAGNPGWVYNFGTLIHLNNSWWPLSRSFHDYLARCSYLLQQGNFVGDVAFYYGDQAPNFVPPKSIPESLGFGYDYDVINSDAILNRLEVKNGRLVLPHGQSYALLVLPDAPVANPEVLKKLMELVDAGATITGPRPVRSYRLDHWQERDREVQSMAANLWGDIDGVEILEHSFGKGKVIWGKFPEEILQEMGVGPDFTIAAGHPGDKVDYIHRRTADADLYFLWNRSGKPLDVDAAFRVANRTPELWDPITGERKKMPVFRVNGSEMQVPLYLPADGSIFVVFKEGPAMPHIELIARNSETVFPDPFREETEKARQFLPLANGSLELPAEGGLFQFNFSSGASIEKTYRPLPPQMELKGPWEVAFQPGWDIPETVVFPELTDWKNCSAESIRYFSGTATYSLRFTWNEKTLPQETAVFLDLGAVREIAEVNLNGTDLGQRWCSPFRFEVSGLLRPGENILRIRVANVLNNRMVGDHKRPVGQRRTHSNITKGPNAWTRPWAEVGLISSGLLGPVRLEWKHVFAEKQ